MTPISVARTGPGPAGPVLVTVLAALLVVYPFVDSWGRYGAVIENGPGATALVVGLARAGDAIVLIPRAAKTAKAGTEAIR